jgi:hypothetical protein
MKQRLSCIMGIIALGMAAIAGNLADASTGTGPYYATPSWDQTMPAATRFIVLSNFNSMAVLDRETGLVWERSPQTDTVAGGYLAPGTCTLKKVGGHPGWRLPTVQELASMIDLTQASPPYLPSGHPFINVQTGFSDYYWSATTDDNDNSPLHAL